LPKGIGGCISLANKLLLQNNKGMLIVWHDKVEKFNTLLTDFYETNKPSKLHKFLYDECIAGIKK
jgi:hypothetical protein